MWLPSLWLFEDEDGLRAVATSGEPCIRSVSAVSVPDGPGRCLSPVPGVGLAVDATDVVPGRDLSNEEGSGDVLIGEAPREQVQDLPLTGTELHCLLRLRQPKAGVPVLPLASQDVLYRFQHATAMD